MKMAPKCMSSNESMIWIWYWSIWENHNVALNIFFILGVEMSKHSLRASFLYLVLWKQSLDVITDHASISISRISTLCVKWSTGLFVDYLKTIVLRYVNKLFIHILVKHYSCYILSVRTSFCVKRSCRIYIQEVEILHQSTQKSGVIVGCSIIRGRESTRKIHCQFREFIGGLTFFAQILDEKFPEMTFIVHTWLKLL
jgi:hypothetical protein